MGNGMSYAKLHTLSFALALAIFWAVALFIIGIFVGMTGGYGFSFVSAVGNLYLGYQPTFIGSLIGAVWGFADAFISGLIFVWLYNVLVAKFQKIHNIKEE